MLELFHQFLFIFPERHDEFCIRSKLIHSVMEQKTMCDPAQNLCGLHVNKYPMLEYGFASLLTFDTSAACVMRELWQIEQNYHLNISFIFTKPTPFIFPPNSFIPLFNALSCRKNKLNEGISVSSDMKRVLYHWKLLLREGNTQEFIDFIYTADNNPNACGEYLEQKVSEISYNQQDSGANSAQSPNFYSTGSNVVSSEGSKHTNYSDNSYVTAVGSDATSKLKSNPLLNPLNNVILTDGVRDRISDYLGADTGGLDTGGLDTGGLGTGGPTRPPGPKPTTRSGRRHNRKGGSKSHKPKFTRRKNKKSPKRKTIKKRKMPKRKNKTRRNK